MKDEQDFYGIHYEGTPRLIQPDGSGTRYYRNMTWFFTFCWDKYHETQEVLITMHGHTKNGAPIHRTKLVVFLDKNLSSAMDDSWLNNLMLDWGFD